MTNLRAEQVPAASFGMMYSRRWNIEEIFERLKLRLKRVAESGTSQHPALVDMTAKMLADNLYSIMSAVAQARSPTKTKRRS